MIMFFFMALPEPMERLIDWFNRTGEPVGFEMLVFDKDAGILGSGGLYYFKPENSMTQNPAYPLNFAEGGRVFSASHRQYVAGSYMDRITYASYSMNMYYAFFFEGLFSPDMELHGDVPDTSISTYSGYDVALGLFMGRTLSHLNIGLGLKLLREKIFIEEENTFSFDIGLNYNLYDATFNIAFLHLGPKYRGESRLRLPTTWRAGAGYIYRGNPVEFMLGVDFVKPLYNVTEIYTGFEVKYQFFSIRGGKKYRDLIERYSGGFGLDYKNFTVDYSVSSMYNNLGLLNTLTINWRF